jgi:hypothetical protein
MITWQTDTLDPSVITERELQNIPIAATSTIGPITFELISGALPRGLRINAVSVTTGSETRGSIVGSTGEVKRFTTSRFVIRASDGVDIEDRTFSLSVDGSDVPEWLTKEGFLNVGPATAYFVLDNSEVHFQLDATDTDLTAGDTLEFYLVPQGGELPPGLSLSRAGLISGFTDPIFALEYNGLPNGGYDTAPLDVTPLDFVEARSNGFDTFFYDNQTYDYNEPSRVPKRLSRIYNFVVAVSDGINSVNRLFKIFVVTEEFLQADNSIVQVDTNLFQADSASDRKPLWITESNLGRFRANNYVTIFLDVYDPPALSGTITYFLLPTNPDNSVSQLPPGMELDSITGDIAGRVPYQSAVTKTYQFTMTAVNFPATLANTKYTLRGDWNAFIIYQVNDAVKYLGGIYICTLANRNNVPEDGSDYWYRGVSTADKTFTVDIVGEIESSVEWTTDSDRGSIKPNQPSQLYIRAESKLYGGRIAYEFMSGRLPPGLTFLSTGDIEGKVKQFADAAGPGLTRFYEKVDNEGPNSSTEDSSLVSRDYTVVFDSENTTFDKKFTFTVKAKDAANFAESLRTFYITVVSDNTKTFSNLYVKAFQSKEKRLAWYNFITNATVFAPNEIYRYGDPNFGIQTDLKVLIYAGVESVDAVKYVQAMSRNHYRKRLLFGNIKFAEAKDPITQETVYEIVYIDVVDDLEKNGKSISQTVQLSDTINSKVLTSYNAINVDSNIPLVSDSDHQRVFPNSIKNMRNQIKGLGERDREFLPLWMRSIQENTAFESGFVKALPLCFANPGKAQNIIARIRAANFDFKSIDFLADRYIIDILDGEIEDKYLAFPQRGEKLP